MAVKINILSTFNPAGVIAAEKRMQRLAENTLASTDSMAGGWVRTGREVVVYGRKLEQVGRKVSSLGDSMTRDISLPIAAAAVVAVKWASDVEESTNKVDVVFEDAADSVKEFAKQGARALGMSERAALEAAGTFGNLLTATGLAEEQAADMSTTMVQLAADMASFNNASPEEVLLAIRSGLSGETEPLKRFGVNLNDATLKQKALNLGIYEGTGLLTANQKAQAAYAVILEQTGKAQGDFARTSDGLANQTRVVRAQMEDAAATMGENLLPVAADLMTMVAGLTERFAALSPEQQKTVIGFGLVAAAIGPVASVTGRVITLTGSLIEISGRLVISLGKVIAAENAAAASGTTLAASTRLAQAGYVGLALAVGVTTGNLINQIPAVKRSGDEIARLAGEVDNLTEFFRESNRIKPWWAKFTQVGAGIYGIQEAAGAAGIIAGGNARGDIVTRPQLSWLAEGGYPESVISWDPALRSRSVDILDKTARALGVSSGATVAPSITVNVGGSNASPQAIAAAVEEVLRRTVRSSFALGRV
jgi:hypothetical protein